MLHHITRFYIGLWLYIKCYNYVVILTQSTRHMSMYMYEIGYFSFYWLSDKNNCTYAERERERENDRETDRDGIWSVWPVSAGFKF